MPPSKSFQFIVTIALIVNLVACGEDGHADPASAMTPERVLDTPDAMATPDVALVPTLISDAGTTNMCEEAAKRPCADACGQELCIDGRWDSSCQSVIEQCNGHDDNCNGIADENFIELGLNTPCTKRLANNCETLGVWQCGPMGESITCDAPIVMPETEVCDGEDNDCDNAVDEDFPRQTCCTQAYQCPLGHLCENNECIDPNVMPTDPDIPLTCSNDSDCSFIEACVMNSCRLICIDNVDCGTGFSCECGSICDLKTCLPTDINDECTSNSGCPAQSFCQNGQCVPDDAYCFDNAQCLNGEICDLAQNRCVDDPNMSSGQCQSNVDCPGGYECDGDGNCVRLPSGGPRCVFEQDCPTGYFCDISNRCISLYANANFCAHAISLSGTGQYEGTLLLGGQNLVVPICGYHYIQGVLPAEVSDEVFRWTVPHTGRFIIDTAGSSFDTVVARYNGCTQESIELVCNDDFEYPDSTNSKLSLMLNANEVVYLGLSGMDPFANGAFNLNYYPACTTISDCNGLQICDNGRCIEDLDPQCIDDDECPEDAICRNGVCFDDMTPSVVCSNDSECPQNERCIDGDCRGETSNESNFCDDVIPLPETGTITETTAAGTQLLEPACAPATGLPGKDRVFAWTPAASDNYSIRTVGDHPNPILSIFTSCSEDTQLLNCDDDSGDGLNGAFTIFASAGTTYFIVVSSASDLFDGAFDLRVAAVSPSPEDPECTFSNNHECGDDLVCLNGACVQATSTGLCGRAESLIGGSRSSGRCNYPKVIEDELSAPIITDCVDDGYDGSDTHWRWQPCRPGRYQITAQADAVGVDVSLALYTECNGNRTHLRSCQNESTDGDETIEIDIAPNYFLSSDPYGLFQEIVISSRNANSSGIVRLIIDCIEGECLDD